MNPQTYKALKKIIIIASELKGKEKKDYIIKSCQKHPDLANILKEMLIEMLKEDEIVQDVFEQSVVINYNTIKQETIAEINAKIKDYEVIEKLGSGGMGDVYQANQLVPVKRQVALKILKKTHNQQLLISETQILAQLNHPNIATLYDVNKTDDEQMFLVMELIQGDDIISWCEKHQYGMLEKIKLFQQLCAGISFAHEKGIIHCDIKPTNIQVTQSNEQVILKVIDFGISQLIEKSNDNKMQEISGTPAYLCPEVLHSQGKILSNTRRDVYALGILLHKLMTGHLPKKQTKNQTIKTPVNHLAIDMRAIINKAMAHEMDNRYASANDLNQDLNRFLNKQPVNARELTLSYGLTRFIQRRLGVVVFSMVLIIAIITGFIAQSIQAKKAQVQAKIAIKQSKAAKTAQNEAEELTVFLVDLFNLSNPERSNRSEITTGELIDKANSRLLEIKAPTLSDARFMQTIGSIYTRMDRLLDAKLIIEKSLSVKTLNLPTNHNEIIISMIELGLINRRLKYHDVAEQYLQKALKLLTFQANPGPNLNQT